MKVLTEFLEISVNFFQGFILVYFAYAVLGSRKEVSFFKSAGFFYGIGLAVMISVINYFMVFEHFCIVLYVLLILVYSAVHLKGTMYFKVFVSVFSIMVTVTASVITPNLFSFLFDISLENILSSRSIERYITMAVTQLLILYILLFSMHIFKKEFSRKNEMAVSELVLISFVLCVSIGICVFLNLMSLSSASRIDRIFIMLIFVGILLINIVTCYLTIDLNRKNFMARENEILKIKQEYNRQYIENAEIQYDAIRKMRHDLKDHCSVIYTFLNEGKISNAMEYIGENTDISNEMLVFVKTKNDIANAVINLKLSAARSLGIDCSCASIADITGIDDTDIFSLLSNMLGNAVTASVNSRRKIIQLDITADEWSYTFSLKNSIDSSVLSENPELATTKENKEGHGFGTRIIRDIAKKYNGVCDFYEENGFFCCIVLLNKTL